MKLVGRIHWQGALAGILAIILAGCGLSSGSKATPTPAVVTSPPSPTSQRTVLVVTSTPKPGAKRVTVLVVVTPTKTATPKPKKHTPTPRPKPKKHTPTPRPKKHTATPTPKPKHHKPAPTPTRVVHKKPTATPHPKRHAAPTPTRVVHHPPTATPRPRPKKTATPRPTHTPRPRPTHTPRPRPTKTATPRPRPTRTPRPRPTRTPTPRPHPSATRAPAGPHLGVIPQSPSTERTIQRLADTGRASALVYRNPIAVLHQNLPGYGFRGPFTIDQPIVVPIRSRGKVYDAYLKQLAKKGTGGAWFITAIEPAGVKPAKNATPGPATPTPPNTPHVGLIPHSPSQITTVQTRAAAGDKAYVYYLNPIAVVERNLGGYGFAIPAPLVEPLKLRVSYRSAKYDVTMVQPVTKGVLGIWVVSRIGRHTA